MQRDSCLGPVLFRGRSVEYHVLWPIMDPDWLEVLWWWESKQELEKNQNNRRQIFWESKWGCFQINWIYLIKSVSHSKLQGSADVTVVRWWWATWNFTETTEKGINFPKFTPYILHEWWWKNVPVKISQVKSSLDFPGILLPRLELSFPVCSQ